MGLRFTKMHGLGNDFIVIDGIHQSIHLTPAQIAVLAKRTTGIGFDQCLLVEASRENGIDFFYRIFNANGQEVGQCGNGARCLARFLYTNGLTRKKTIRVATHTTAMELHIHEDDTVTVDMGRPKLDPKDIPLNVAQPAKQYTLPVDASTSYTIHAVNVGNPHAVMLVPDIAALDLETIGKAISLHPFFPEHANAGFMQIMAPDKIRLRVYERGAGETSACGSGAVAAVAIGRLYHQLAEQVTVTLPGGELHVHWPSFDAAICLRGPAHFVYEGKLLCAL